MMSNRAISVYAEALKRQQAEVGQPVTQGSEIQSTSEVTRESTRRIT